MKPEVCEKWNEVLAAYRKAEHYLASGDHDRAKREAGKAIAQGNLGTPYLFPYRLSMMSLGLSAASIWPSRGRGDACVAPTFGSEAHPADGPPWHAGSGFANRT